MERRFPSTLKRTLLFMFAAAGLALVVSSDRLHGWVVGYLPTVEAIVQARPVLGVTIFVGFAALAALVAFVSSAVIVPIGVYVWGETVTMLLLWAGWILGGVAAYSISRYLGRPVARALGVGSGLDRYEHLISDRAPFGLVLLFQLAVPSEVPGHLLGLGRYTFSKYLAALALAELPYAVATTYLGASFIHRQPFALVAVALTVAGLSGWALYTLHRRFAEPGVPR